ncbi:putative UDP-glucose flavonoid 3-O-glucosyltransferase 3 [Olea europaea var. sylvestris]|uniref:putative UDP-glucose flavonoid 3-O-glucosyltransferase 3 n=1 Tax=Olea europaea var. sylvestris TaxID=158386 RepID=UPI000C1CDAE0|nr:putative UDP-glucose flavonoid 3-O-glucosyltransferase 3 [Olea europaea var. sylvestris]
MLSQPSTTTTSTSTITTKSIMKKAELVFIPSPRVSHLMSTVEMAKLLLQKDARMSITVLIMKFPNDTVLESYTQKLFAATDPSSRLRLINLPGQDELKPIKSETFFFDFIDSQAILVRNILSNMMESSDSQLAGIVIDMFCTSFIDVANELGLNSYIFFTSGAACLSLFLHLVSLFFEHNQDLTQYKNSDVELPVPCFSIPVPAKVLPYVFVEDASKSKMFLGYFKKFRETNGIMVNTFSELESYAIQALSTDENTPKIYPVGPILNLNENNSPKNESDEFILDWLDKQSESSVVFLCFGSMGSFDECQVKEIATALENSGQRFLWSLRKPPPKDKMEFPEAYDDPQEVLPDGFIERTKEVGKVIGWAPQMAVLSHPAVGGFLSHCGWNSTLESVWCGVPMATWPMFAEQQLNAFQLVKDLGIAEAIRIDYRRDFKAENPVDFVPSEDIESGILRLMGNNGKNEMKQKVTELKNKSRMALQEGGSSYTAQSLFIEDVINSIA